MGRAGSSQIGVEGGSQPTDQEFGSVAHGDPIVLHGHGTIRDETEKARPVDDGSPRVPIMRPSDSGQVHGHVAHEPLDDVGAEAVVFREGVALDGCKPIVGDAFEIVAGRDRVLHEPFAA